MLYVLYGIKSTLRALGRSTVSEVTRDDVVVSQGFVRTMLTRVDALTAQIDQLTARIEDAIAALSAQVAQLDEIPGVGITGTQEILAEIGADMTRFPTPGHLVPWAKSRRPRASPPGAAKLPPPARATWLGGTIGEAATATIRTRTFLAARYKRVVRRRGKKRALVAVGNSILVIAWHFLSQPAPTTPTLAPTGMTGSHRSAASDSSSPS